MKKWLRHQLWNICWEIGDTFMGLSFKLLDKDETGQIDKTGWVTIDVHEHCRPKYPVARIIDSTVPVTLATGTSTTVDWS